MSVKADEKPAATPDEESPKAKNLLLAILFGLIFGFLLQKGGAAKYNVLMGVMLLEDFTIVKLMLSAIVVGMLGVFTLVALGKAKLVIKPTKIGANVIGGLIFGVGFALMAYCPGTGAAAFGQGNWDAIFGIVGLIAGSYIYAELSETLERTVKTWGDYGKITLPEVLRLPRAIVVPAVAVMLIGVLFLLHKYTGQR
jgi:uncharacterized membrane protein YedE/YeeE